MAKIALIGDTHFGVRNDNQTFYKSQKEYFDWLLPLLKESGIKTIIQLGDLFDRRKYINFKTLHETKRNILDQINKDFTCYILAGNHDVFFRNTNEVNSVRLLLAEYNNIQVFDDSPTTITVDNFDIDVFPWICAENYASSVEYANYSQSSVAVGHFEFSGFEMYKGSVSEHGMDADGFKDYDMVFSGHYHTYSRKNNVTYVGVPYEMTWSDYADPKGIVIFDTDTKQFTRLMTPFTKFIKVFYDDKNGRISDIDSLDLSGMFVKLIVANKTDYYKYDQYVNKLLTKGAEDVKILEESINSAIESIDGDSLKFDDTPTLMESYVDELEQENLDKAKLKSILRSLYVEASNQ